MSASPTTSPSPDSALAALALSLVDGVGPATWHELVATFGSAAHALSTAAFAGVRARVLEDARDALARGERAGARLITLGDGDYPPSLVALRDPPPVLWALGAMPAARAPVVAIVGTRGATEYGNRMARRLADAFARAGAVVVSGMARGIDGAAHQAALAARGHTIAVLGTGVDVPYPVAHRGLHREIAAHGLVLTELPPGAGARAGSFPRRNRVIAALASLTIVVEAGLRSGALITAGDALELGRTVACVPGPMDAPQSEGTNLLLRDGAQVLASIDDALALAGLAPRPAPAPPDDPHEARVWAALARGAPDLDSLAAAAGLPARDCLVAVTALELRGMIECTASGEVRRIT